MRKFSILAIFSLMAFLSTNVKAQNSDHRWALGVYGNWINFSVQDDWSKASLGDFQGKNQMIPSAYSVGRFISPSVNVVGAFSTNKFDNYLGNEWTYMRWLRTDKFWDMDASVEYKFANGYILKENSWFAPYAYVGLGVANYNTTTYFKEVFGLGADIWFLKNVALNIHGSADILNSADNYLHLSTGVKVRFGKGSDKDKDGVADKKDLCPDVFGLKEFAGCPDTDGDGIADKDDACPDVKGIAAFKGCPDTDGDGIIDSQDDCPTQAGLEVFKGCPDTDGDGVPDKDDLCPTVAGTPDHKGCPFIDTDGDGIQDSDDKCPKEKGPIENHGCPLLDTDGDGIPDVNDKCPSLAGVASNNGCPEIKKEEQEIINTAFESLEFQTAKSTIKPVSYPSLQRLADLLKKKPDWKLQLSGHTDNVGSEASNMTLSKNRANSVKKYLVKRGVPAERIKTEWFGETVPIAPNETPDGRQTNRRVEIGIFF